ncbi:MAG: phosphodiester glycosidase family protein [Pedosphaera sp.]|nr:phosphodiester glycosidase family protein [Pedosphaera sp.]
MMYWLTLFLGAAALVGTEASRSSEKPPVSQALAPRNRLANGFSYIQETLAEGPWSIQVIRIRRDRTDLGIHVLLGGGDHLGVATLSSQASTFPRARGQALAALNGDFFAREGPCLGDPEGLCIRDGEFISAPNGKSAFWMGPDRSLHLGPVVSLLSMMTSDGTSLAIGLNEERQERPVLFTAAVGPRTPSSQGTECRLIAEAGSELPIRPGIRSTFRLQSVHSGGNTVIPTNGVVLSLPVGHEIPPSQTVPGSLWTLSTETRPDLKNTPTALGGGPALLKDGRSTQFQSSDARHPRSAIGWNAEFFFLVQVDGRQRGLSVGMSLAELAAHFARLGCTDALNLDGGGSSTLWARGQVMNTPCEGSERPMGNALIITLEPSAVEPR